MGPMGPMGWSIGTLESLEVLHPFWRSCACVWTSQTFTSRSFSALRWSGVRGRVNAVGRSLEGRWGAVHWNMARSSVGAFDAVFSKAGVPSVIETSSGLEYEYSIDQCFQHVLPNMSSVGPQRPTMF